ncbi:MAG TPA: SCO family protein [Solirubrobacteraceae bacterium]|nr:SCO family protein [Solirubrobacteraceae bacterium]
MPGMSTGLEASDPTVVSAFHRALLTQGVVILVILLLVATVWLVLRALQMAQPAATRAGTGPAGAGVSASAAAGVAIPARPAIGAFPAIPAITALAAREPAARRLLRIGFGLLWVFDGILQSQPAMPLGMGPDVIQPTAAASPHWVQHLDNALVTVWSYHPVAAAAAAVWIQIGIGAWLLAAPRGNWSRLGGVASVLWGLSVWVFGEAFGGIFAPGLTWLFGAPGAALLYCFAGLLIALPERAWSTPRTGRVVLRTIGAFFIGMALLQAWPGRGFWEGQPRAGATSGTLTAMIREMSQTPQPHFLSALLSSFADFVAAHAWEVNLFAVLALAGIGTAFVTARPRIVRVAVLVALVLCLADWVLIEDFGFFGGVGTDPNSMIPMALLFVAGYLAVTRLPAGASEPGPTTESSSSATPPWGQRLRAEPSYMARSLAAVAALAVTIVGAVPMAVAASEPHAAAIISEAVDGTPNLVNLPSTPFTLLDQHGRPVSLASLRGKTVALTFLDDLCTSDCPVIAQEFRMADALLGADRREVELVAVNANPRFTAPDYLAAFDRQEHLEGMPNWLYLTGSLRQLEHVWSSYGATVEYSPGGAMIDHSESADVIDANGRVRYVLDTDPGPATEASKSSFSVTLADAIRSAIRAS